MDGLSNRIEACQKLKLIMKGSSMNDASIHKVNWIISVESSQACILKV
jgi:hypothetical protein